jgi:hypothetical protein
MGRKKGSVGQGETKWKEALKRLLDGESFEKLRGAYSQSVLYTALNEFLKQAPQGIADQQHQLGELRSSISAEQKNLSALKAERESQQKATEEARSLRLHAEARLKSTETAVKRATDNVIDLTDKWVALGKKGVTQKNLTEVYNLGLDGQQLLTRTATVEGYQEVIKEFAMKKAETFLLENQKKDLQLEMPGLRKEVANLKTEAASQRAHNQAIERDLALIQQYYAEGYDYDTQVSIFNALKAVSIKGDPKRSAKNLADAVAKTKGLVDYEEAVKKLIIERDTLERIIADPKTNLTSLGNRVYKQLDETTMEACNKIQAAGSEIVKSIEEVKTAAVTGVNDVTEHEKTVLQAYVKNSLNQLTFDANILLNQLASENANLHEDTEKFLKEVAKYAAFREVFGKSTAVMDRVNEISTLIQRPETAAKVTPMTIQQVTLAIYYWTNANMKNIEHPPSEAVKKIEPNPYQLSNLRLFTPTLAYWLYEAIQQHVNTTSKV